MPDPVGTDPHRGVPIYRCVPRQGPFDLMREVFGKEASFAVSDRAYDPESVELPPLATGVIILGWIQTPGGTAGNFRLVVRRPSADS